MKVSVVTPTADRPVAFALAERWMARQTFQPDEWIVADGGQRAVDLTMGQHRYWAPRCAGAENFAHNLLNGLRLATGDVVVFVEDDDWYSPTHIETLVNAFGQETLCAGDNVQQYYNVQHRLFRRFDNVGASLCQTAIRRAAIPLFESIVHRCLASKTYGIDTTFWRAVPTSQWAITGKVTCVGIKGLSGQSGLGIGHRPDGPSWTPDPTGAKLRELIGADADVYLSPPPFADP